MIADWQLPIADLVNGRRDRAIGNRQSAITNKRATSHVVVL